MAFLFLIICTLYSQSIKFNRYYDSLTPYNGDNFSTVIESDSGYAVFNTIKFSVHYLDSLGNLTSSKNFYDTNAIWLQYWNWNNSIDVVEPVNTETEKYYIQASGMQRSYYDTVYELAYHLTKFNSNFDTVWTSKILYNDYITPSNWDLTGDLFDCVVDADGFIYSTGGGYKLLDGTSFTNIINLMFLKADSLGNPITIRNYPFINTNQSSYGTRIMETPDNNILIGGNLGFFPQGNNYPSPQIYLLKVNKLGDFIWHKSFGNSTLFDLIITKDSNYIVSGISAVFVSNSYYNSAYISKQTPNGDIIWETKIGKMNKHLAAKQIKELDDGSFICVGSYY